TRARVPLPEWVARATTTWAGGAFRLAGPGDHRLRFGAVERSHRRSAYVPQSAETQERGRERFGVGRIENADEVIRADRPIDLLDLHPEVLPGLIRLVDAARRVPVALDALLRPVEEDDERGHPPTSLEADSEPRLYGIAPRLAASSSTREGRLMVL